jgi:hypothetical protein
MFNIVISTGILYIVIGIYVVFIQKDTEKTDLRNKIIDEIISEHK